MVLKVRSLAGVPVETCLGTPELGEMKLISPSVSFCQGENNGPKRKRHSLKFLSRRGSSPRCRIIVQFLENSLRVTHSPESPWAVILQVPLHRGHRIFDFTAWVPLWACLWLLSFKFAIPHHLTIPDRVCMLQLVHQAAHGLRSNAL